MEPKYQGNTHFEGVNFKKYATIFGGLFLFGICFGCVPTLFLKVSTPNKIGLPGSEIRELYSKPPFPKLFKVYLFNVTNKDDVTDGARPSIQEIGPYVFEQWQEKFDLTDDDEGDTLTFNMRKTYIYRSDLSNGLTGHENFTAVHPLIMGMALTINVNRQPMLKVVNKAINAIFHQPTDPFWTGRVLDYLFDGIEIDCTSNEFSAQAACTVFESGMVKSIEPLRKDFFKFSIFGAMNGSGIGLYRVDRGIKNVHDVGRVLSFDNKTEMEVWDGDECNRYRGTDATVFPPGLQKEDGLWSFEPNLCFSVGAHYESESHHQGVPTKRFEFDFGDAAKNEKLQCYCSDPPNTCPRRGTLNLFDCLEAPIIISLPHFYNADPYLLTQIQSGLVPNEDKHSYFIEYETITGSEINAVKRLQLNLDVVPIDAIDTMKHVPEVVMPLFWIEEITAPAAKSQMFANLVKYQQQILILQIIQWIAVVTGAVGAIYSTFMHFKNRNGAIEHITKPTDYRESSNPVYKVSGVSVAD